MKMKMKIDEMNRNATLMKMEQRRDKQKIIDLQETVSYYESERRHVETLKLQEKVMELEELVSYCESEASTAKAKLLELQVEHNKLRRKCRWFMRIALGCVIAIVMLIMFK